MASMSWIVTIDDLYSLSARNHENWSSHHDCHGNLDHVDDEKTMNILNRDFRRDMGLYAKILLNLNAMRWYFANRMSYHGWKRRNVCGHLQTGHFDCGSLKCGRIDGDMVDIEIFNRLVG